MIAQQYANKIAGMQKLQVYIIIRNIKKNNVLISQKL